MRTRSVIVAFCLILSTISIPQIALVSGGDPRLPFDITKPYALVVGDSGHLFVFDGQKLYPFPTSTSFDLNQVKWRHDGAYALAVGENSTLLKISIVNGVVAVQRIPTPLLPIYNLESVTWKADDSSALVSGPGGKFLLYDGQRTTLISSGITVPIFASAWSPTSNRALLVGQSGLIADYNGTNTSVVTPALTNDSFFGVGWDPSGNYALVGGDHAALFMYQQGRFTQQNTAVLFEVAPHLIRSVSFNQDSGTGLVSGQLGLTVIATQTHCDYNIFYTANSVCLAYKRIQYYNDLNGTRVDLHRIGHFYDAGWMPGTQDAYGVGTALDGSFIAVRGWTVARVTTSQVTLVAQDRKANFSLRSIDWQPAVKESNQQMLTWYFVAPGSVGLVAIVLVSKRKTLKNSLVHLKRQTNPSQQTSSSQR